MKAKLDTLIAEHHAECQRKDQEIASAQQALLDQRTAMRQAQQVILEGDWKLVHSTVAVP